MSKPADPGMIMSVEGSLFIKGSPRVRIGGVLIVVAIGLCLSGFQNLVYFLGSLLPFVRSSLWQRLTNSTSEAFHPQWKGFLIYQLIVSSLIFAANVLVLILFFRKSRLFPKLIIALIPLTFLSLLASHFWTGLIPVVANTAEYAKEGHRLLVQFVALHLWIPYFALSNRVKETFVS
jgi:hypothetical protein